MTFKQFFVGLCVTFVNIMERRAVSLQQLSFLFNCATKVVKLSFTIYQMCVQAHTISERVYDINLTDQTAETIGKVRKSQKY